MVERPTPQRVDLSQPRGVNTHSNKSLNEQINEAIRQLNDLDARLEKLTEEVSHR